MQKLKGSLHGAYGPDGGTYLYLSCIHISLNSTEVRALTAESELSISTSHWSIPRTNSLTKTVSSSEQGNIGH